MKILVAAGAAFFVLGALYISNLYHFLLFHSLAELFSIFIAFGIFMVAWNTRRFHDTPYLLFIGIAYLFVGGLDLAHTLAYEGMGILDGHSSNTPTQLWIAARYMESLSLLSIPLVLHRRINSLFLILGYTLVTGCVLLSVFYWQNFPDCFLENAGGLTRFKINSEYIICLLLLIAAGLITLQRHEFSSTVFRWILASILIAVFAELSFTAYANVYGGANLLGHFLKIISFYCLYKAIIETGLRNPYELLFRDLKLSKERYQSLFDHMINGFADHEMVFDQNGNPVDYRYLEVNHAFELLTGFTNVVGKRATQVIPGIENDPANWIQVYGKVAVTGKPVRYENYSQQLNKWYYVIVYSIVKNRFVTIFEDISERKAIQEEIIQQKEKLHASQQALKDANIELENKVRERTANLAGMVDSLETEVALRRQAEDDLTLANTQLTARANQLRELMGKLTRAEQKERKRLAKVLHDGLQQHMVLAKFQLGGISRQLKDTDLKQAVLKIESVMGEAIQMSRSLSADLIPPVLRKDGLAAGLKWIERRMKEHYNFTVDLCIDTNVELPEDASILVFESLRELLFNAVKHAGVAGSKVHLKNLNGTHMQIIVSDEGGGFNPPDVTFSGGTGTGFGLFSIQERIGLIGGVFEIDSTPGKGSRFVLTIPDSQFKTARPGESSPG